MEFFYMHQIIHLYSRFVNLLCIFIHNQCLPKKQIDLHNYLYNLHPTYRKRVPANLGPSIFEYLFCNHVCSDDLCIICIVEILITIRIRGIIAVLNFLRHAGSFLLQLI